MVNRQLEDSDSILGYNNILCRQLQTYYVCTAWHMEETVAVSSTHRYRGDTVPVAARSPAATSNKTERVEQQAFGSWEVRHGQIGIAVEGNLER